MYLEALREKEAARFQDLRMSYYLLAVAASTAIANGA
jgi:hypothetical protein